MNISCLLCRSKTCKKLFIVNSFALYKCDQCSFVFVFPIPNNRILSLFYKKFDYQNPEIAENVIRNDARRSLSIIRKYIKKGSLLDLGCGRGYLLDEARNQGWEVYGVDYSKNVLEYSRSKLALEVEEGNIVKFRTNRKYDVIVINQVIEHFSNPKFLIDTARLALKTGGIVYIATPNINSYLSRFKKEAFDYIIPPEHLSYFSKKSLNYLLSSLGFKLRYCGSWSYSQDLAGVIKSIIGIKRVVAPRILNSSSATAVSTKFSKIKKFKSVLFDNIFCKIFYTLLNTNDGGTNLEVIYQK